MFLFMYFGTSNEPSTSMYLIKKVLKPYLHMFVIVFIDNILIYSCNDEDHVSHLKIVLKTFKEMRVVYLVL